MRLLLAATIVCSTVAGYRLPANAEPRSAKDCSGIEESFAYNDCIAKFGPSGAGKIVSHGAGAILANAPLAPTPIVPQSTNGASVSGPERYVPQRYTAPPTARAAPQRVTGSIYQRRANGRYFAVFQVGVGAVKTVPSAKVSAPRTAPVVKAVPRKVTPASYSRWRGYRRH